MIMTCGCGLVHGKREDDGNGVVCSHESEAEKYHDDKDCVEDRCELVLPSEARVDPAAQVRYK